MEWIILVMIGLIAGSVGAMAGLGGGIIVVPALLFVGTFPDYFNGITPQVAVGTSLIVMIFTGLSSTLSYMRHKTIDYKSGFIFFAGSGPGSIVGAWVNKYIHIQQFNLYFGIFIVLIGFLLIIRNKLKPVPLNKNSGVLRHFKDNYGDTYTYGYHPVLAILITFIVGFTSGLFGVGGGSLIVPAMIILFLTSMP